MFVSSSQKLYKAFAFSFFPSKQSVAILLKLGHIKVQHLFMGVAYDHNKPSSSTTAQNCKTTNVQLQGSNNATVFMGMPIHPIPRVLVYYEVKSDQILALYKLRSGPLSLIVSRLMSAQIFDAYLLIAVPITQVINGPNTCWAPLAVPIINTPFIPRHLFQQASNVINSFLLNCEISSRL